MLQLGMGYDQNLRECSVNLILCFTIWVNRKVRERLFSISNVILSEKLTKVCVISREIAKITGIGHEQDFTF